MIGYLKGRVMQKEEHKILLEVHDVGYEVLLPKRMILSLKETEIALQIYHHVREDAQTLYGFAKPIEKKLFLALLDVNGVGPKSALAVLESDPNEIIRAIASGDPARLKGGGVGLKTAEKIVLELKDKVTKLFPEINYEHKTIKGWLPNTSSIIEEGFADELKSALQSLGYNPREIEVTLQKNAAALAQADNVEAAIKILLKNL